MVCRKRRCGEEARYLKLSVLQLLFPVKLQQASVGSRRGGDQITSLLQSSNEGKGERRQCVAS